MTTMSERKCLLIAVITFAIIMIFFIFSMFKESAKERAEIKENTSIIQNIVLNNTSYSKKEIGAVERYEFSSNFKLVQAHYFIKPNNKEKDSFIIVYLDTRNVLFLYDSIPMKANDKLYSFEADIDKNSDSIYFRNRTFVCNESNQCSLAFIKRD